MGYDSFESPGYPELIIFRPTIDEIQVVRKRGDKEWNNDDITPIVELTTLTLISRRSSDLSENKSY